MLLVWHWRVPEARTIARQALWRLWVVGYFEIISGSAVGIVLYRPHSKFRDQ
jgi:hypothetical protein